MPSTDRPAPLPRLDLRQLEPAYREALASHDPRVLHVALELLWRHLVQTLEVPR
jgi:hypothetical protein